MKLIAYDQLVHDALRRVVRDVLKRTQEKGLPGQHHFYITFESKYCEMADWLKKRYTPEMTIVIQQQYEDLVVDEDRFSVTLYFDNRRERLSIPLKAMTGFTDPHASFSLRMASDVQESDLPPPAPNKPPQTPQPPQTMGEVVNLDHFRKQK